MGVTGLEPVTLRLSSACSNQLSYTPAFALRASARQARRWLASRSSLQRAQAGGAEEIRTPDLQLAKLPLYQLSYSPLPIFDLRFAILDFQIRNPQSEIRNANQSSISFTCLFKEHCP